MPLPEPWSKSVLAAWDYMVSGARQGLTATDAYQQYTAGGGKIRTSWWYAGFKEAFGMIGVRDSIMEIPKTYTIPETMSTRSGMDWTEKYIFQGEWQGVDPKTGSRFKRWVTVESNELLTKSEWEFYSQQAVDMTPGSIPIIIERLTDANFYVKI